MRKWIVPAVVGLLVAAWTMPEAVMAADVAAPRLTRSAPHVRVHIVRRHKRHRVRHVAVRRGPRYGRYFYCPPPENVCQLTPRLVWTPKGYRRVFYPRLVWSGNGNFGGPP